MRNIVPYMIRHFGVKQRPFQESAEQRRGPLTEISMMLHPPAGHLHYLAFFGVPPHVRQV